MEKNYYVFENGELKRKDDTIYVVTDEEKKPLPIKNVGALHLMGELDFNTRFFDFLSQEETPAHYYNWFDRYSGSFYPQEFLPSGRVLVNQVRCYDDDSRRMEVAREIVRATTDNIVENLRYYDRKGKDVADTIEEIAGLQQKIENATNTDELRGVEGRIRKAYYGTFSTILRGGFTFGSRSRQPPENEVNALISFGNSLLYATTLTEIYKTHLNPTISYLHEPRERRFSLSLDLSEVFKPVIVDRVIFSVVNRQQVQQDDFREDMNGCLLDENGRKEVVRAYEERLETTVEHPTLEKNVSHQRLLRLEGYKLVKHISDDDRYNGYRMPERA
jgi:CRISPR-associated protein Cas1